MPVQEMQAESTGTGVQEMQAGNAGVCAGRKDDQMSIDDKEEMQESTAPGSGQPEPPVTDGGGDRPGRPPVQASGQEDGWRIPEPEEKKFNWKAELLEWFKIILSAAVIAFVLNTFIIANSQVPSGSMETTIMTNDRVIGSRLSYVFSEPERGDIVIFRFPDNEKIYYVKRIIGLPGETVDIVDGKVYLNGSSTPMEEPYIREPMVPEPPMHFEVPEDCYFMMGDNRNFSSDARRWQNTYVKRRKIVAKVLFRYFPKIHWIR